MHVLAVVNFTGPVKKFLLIQAVLDCMERYRQMVRDWTVREESEGFSSCICFLRKCLQVG